MPRQNSPARSRVEHCPGPNFGGAFSRRTALQMGSIGLASLGFSDLLRLQAQAKALDPKTPETAMIFVWLPGGPPHLDMYDMKPNLSSEYRGEFRPIRTNVSGIEVSELMPYHAKCADKYTVIRSVHHKFADHGGGHKRFLTARDPRQPDGFVNDTPMVGSMISKLREQIDLGLPNYVSLVDGGRQHIDTFSFGSAYLPPSTHPFFVVGDPSRPEFKVENIGLLEGLADRVDGRKQLLSQFDKFRRDVDTTKRMDALDKFGQQALGLATSQKAREAFDLSQEPETTRDRYGHNPFGARALMARRLVEAGCSFVSLVMENCLYSGQPYPEEFVYNWDSHAVNCHIWKDARVRFPIYDQAVTALIEDIYARGLDKRVLLLVTGEFGRTPRLEYHNGRPGRDHWPNSMSMIMAGGGIKTGQIIGSTNAKGEEPKDRPLTPNDIWATCLHHLKINPEHSFLDHNGRPLPILPYGDVVSELF